MNASCDGLLKRFVAKDRKALAEAITLIESEKPEHTRLARELLISLPKRKEGPTIRIALSGPPGVGKSTLINSMGQWLLKAGKSVAILAIDPSSEINLGSILADKTRMGDLVSCPEVYIRPSPSRTALGGVSLKTRDVISLVESFGFDVVILETVGVGQSESLAWSISDHYVLLFEPGLGDSLQAMKRGNSERADFLLVNKIDTELLAAKKTRDFLRSGIAHDQEPMLVSAHTGEGVGEFLLLLLKVHAQKNRNGELLALRRRRVGKFFEAAVRHEIWQAFVAHEQMREALLHLQEDLGNDDVTLSEALHQVMRRVKCLFE